MKEEEIVIEDASAEEKEEESNANTEQIKGEPLKDAGNIELVNNLLAAHKSLGEFKTELEGEIAEIAKIIDAERKAVLDKDKDARELLDKAAIGKVNKNLTKYYDSKITTVRGMVDCRKYISKRRRRII